MTGPQVSVIIPAHNTKATIRDTLRSVRCQTFRDLELIIINDGSTDDLLDHLAPILAEEPRLRVVTQANAGLAGARNRGLAESTAPLVAFIDADDLWHPEFLAALTAALNDNPDAPFAYAFSLRVDADNGIIPAPKWTYQPRHDFAGLLALNSVGCGSAALFRRTALLGAGGFDVAPQARGLQGAEDWKLCLQLAHAQAPELVPRYLVGYRVSTDSMSQSDPARQLAAIHAVMADIRSKYPRTPRRHFANARTLMNGWLLTAFLRKRRYRTVARLLAESYLLNPLWFLSRDLRTIHVQKILSLLWDRQARLPLADYQEDGQRPFSFLTDV